MAQNKRTKEEYAKIAEEIREENNIKALEIAHDEWGIYFRCQMDEIPLDEIDIMVQFMFKSIEKFQLDKYSQLVLLYDKPRVVSNCEALMRKDYHNAL